MSDRDRIKEIVMRGEGKGVRSIENMDKTSKSIKKNSFEWSRLVGFSSRPKKWVFILLLVREERGFIFHSCLSF